MIEHTRSWATDVVRSGLLGPADQLAEITAAIAADHPSLDAARTARGWIDDAVVAWRADAAGWPSTTDFDRLVAAFACLEAAGIDVLQGCADHWVVKAHLDGATPRGVAWFTPPDVWHAIDAGMLEVNLWHGSTANAAPGDDLLDDALACFARAGLEAHFDEGRIEVAAHWQRRPPS